MYLGILIGLFLFGLLLLGSNWDIKGEPAIVARTIGFFSTIIGFCGSIGWILEVTL